MSRRSIMIGLINNASAPMSAANIQQRLGERAQSNVVDKLDDPSLRDPYDISVMVNESIDHRSARIESVDSMHEMARSSVVSINNAQHQQALIEQYISSSSDSDASMYSKVDPYDAYRDISHQADNIKSVSADLARVLISEHINQSNNHSKEQIIDVYA
ncbi:hypothetical protein OAV62_00345 [bacterium]|nr:hypothetical protein [bacterium]